MKPLAYILRPNNFDDIVGQNHLIGKEGIVRKFVENNSLPSIVLYGDPGIGKTTIALVIAKSINYEYSTFNASIDNKEKLKEIASDAKNHDNYIIIIDEIHRMKKDIQDYLLPLLEEGILTLIGLTTINPYHSLNSAIRSRVNIFKLNKVNNENLLLILDKCSKYLNINFTVDAIKYLISLSNGEIRYLINMIEILFLSNKDIKQFEIELVKKTLLKANLTIDKNEDYYFDALSGLHKSIRGSDVNAALHYAAKFLIANDLDPLLRRLICIAYEDISLALPSIGPKVYAAINCAKELGMPEARLPIATIIVDMSLAPKSNSALLAIDEAIKDIEDGNDGNLPLHLKNLYSFDENQKSYKYPHNYDNAFVVQQYLPNNMKNRKYYKPNSNSQYEKLLKEKYEYLDELLKKAN